jgi:hypothetical protein
MSARKEYRNLRRVLRLYVSELTLAEDRLSAFDQEIEMGDAGRREMERLHRVASDLEEFLNRCPNLQTHVASLVGASRAAARKENNRG